METEDSDPKVSNIEGAGEEEKDVSPSADPAAMGAGAAAAESADDPEHAAAAAEVSSVASTDSSAGSKSSPFHGFSSQVIHC